MILTEQIREKDVVEQVKERVDTKKERQSTKILRGVAIALIVGIIFASGSKILECGFNGCVLGGVGAGSIIVTMLWLIADHLKGALTGS